jgi:drug/metabolite transporter (DMT)-like permease
MTDDPPVKRRRWVGLVIVLAGVVIAHWVAGGGVVATVVGMLVGGVVWFLVLVIPEIVRETRLAMERKARDSADGRPSDAD